jgi:hypothetical protein
MRDVYRLTFVEENMMTKQEKEKDHRQLRAKIEKLCSELPLWPLFQVYLYIQKVILQQRLIRITWNWLIFHCELDKKQLARHREGDAVE